VTTVTSETKSTSGLNGTPSIFERDSHTVEGTSAPSSGKAQVITVTSETKSTLGLNGTPSISERDSHTVEGPSAPSSDKAQVTTVTSETKSTPGLHGTPPISEHGTNATQEPDIPGYGLVDDYADLAMVGEIQPRDQDEPEGENDLSHLEEVAALQTNYESAESEALKAITDQPVLVSQTADKLAVYFSNVTDNGDARELDDQVSSYCSRERTTDEPYE
jgi:hypothetical protein